MTSSEQVNPSDVTDMFRDPSLSAAARAAARAAGLCPDIEGFVQLQALDTTNTPATIVNLCGIQICRSLRELDLSASRPSARPANGDSPLVRMGGRALRDLGPLAALSELRFLNLGGQDVVDLEPLANLSQLEVLDISSNVHLTDVTPLGRMQSLRRLNLERDVALRTIAALSELPHLEIINISGAGVCDLPVLPCVTKLIARGAALRDVQDLHGCCALEVIDLSGTQMGVPVDFSGLTRLRALAVDGWSASTLASSTFSKTLEVFSASAAGLTSLAFMARMSRLTKLDVSENAIACIDDVCGLPSIRSLFLQGNPIEDYRPLTKLKTLGELGVSSAASIPSDIKDLLQLQGTRILEF